MFYEKVLGREGEESYETRERDLGEKGERKLRGVALEPLVVAIKLLFHFGRGRIGCLPMMLMSNDDAVMMMSDEAQILPQRHC